MNTRQAALRIGFALLLAVPAMTARSETVNDPALENRIRQDVEQLHEFFVGWYAGTLPDSAYESEFTARLDPAFTIIMPTGVELDHASLSAAMRDSFGQNPGFTIEIRNVRLMHATATTAVATYEEWQFNRQAGPDATTGRVSTVVMARGETLKWLHVHETWLPDEVIAAEQ